MGNWTQSNTNTTDNYAETFRYDANGNILQLNRNGNSQHPGGQAMDRLNYTYRDGTNQLWSVQDGIAAGAYAGDIDNQGGSNYSYDRIGNLIGDVSENISQVNWTVYGKIGNIQKKQAFLGYVYNAGGERVVKQYLPYATNQCLGCDENTGLEDLEVYERNSNTPNVYKASKTITFLSEYTDVRYTEYTAIIEAGLALCTPQCNIQPPLTTSDADIYIRDATGNVLAVYHYDRKTAQLRWSEQHLYGSARLGMYLPEKSVTSVSTDSKQREVGYLGKQIFELSNHLGNVLATITDKKLQVSTNTTSTDYFEADVQTVQDYYAFGMQMPGRKLSGGYRYWFNGKENDNEVKGEGNSQDYGMRIYDPRLGRFLSVDPDFIENRDLSTYSFAANNPIRLIDVDGRYPGEPTIFQEINILYDKLVYTYESSRASLLQSKSQLLKGGFNDLAAQIDIPHPLSKVDKIKMWRASQEIIFKHYGIDKYVEYASYLSAVAAFRKVIAKSGSDGIKYVIRQVQKLGKKEGKELLEELGDNPYFGKAKDEILSSKKSFEKLIKDHKEMLEKMRKDPRGMTKPEKLEQMTKDNPTEEVLMKRLKSQEKEILDQIKKQEGELKKVEQAYKHTQ